MKKIIVLFTLLFAGCASAPVAPTQNDFNNIDNAIALVETGVNVGCPLAVANICVYDIKDCDSAKQSCVAAKNAVVVAKDALAAAKVANDNSGDTLTKILAGVAEASKYINDVNALSTSVGGKPIVVPAPGS